MIDIFHPDNVITVDFESKFGRKLKLGFSHQFTEEYIRDPRWLTHGVGIKKGGNDTLWLYGKKKVDAFFAKADFTDAVMLAHNAKFDGLVLSHHYNIRPRYWLDTRSLAYMVFANNLKSASLKALTELLLPGEVKDQTALFDIEGKHGLKPEEAAELGEYCRGDCDKTHMLYSIFYRMMEQGDRDFNLKTVDLVTRMFTDPVLTLDTGPLGDLLATEVAEKQAALDSTIATSMEQLRSNPQFATLLESRGVAPPMKLSPSDPNKETFAFAKTDRGLLDLLKHDDEEVRKLVEARLRCKSSINETRAQNYLDVAHRGAWPVDLNLSGAKTTHRLSGGMGGGGNPQNLGRKSPLRAAVCAPEGFFMGVCDSSNIELRIAMALAREPVIQKMVDPDYDAYREFASNLYGVEEADVTYDQRLMGKIAMLSLQYGTGWLGFQNAAFNWGVELEGEEAMRIVTIYRNRFPNIVHTWKQLDYILKQLVRGNAEGWWNDSLVFANPKTQSGCAGFTMPRTGLSITYPDLRWERGKDGKRELTYSRWEGGRGATLMDTRIWGAKCFENICQALARNVVFEQQLTLDEWMQTIDPTCRTVMSVHDESVCLMPDYIKPAVFTTAAEEIFSTSPDWWVELPVFGEAATGMNYAEAK